jgi:hypothetical protein
MKLKLDEAVAIKTFFELQLENVARKKREVNLQIKVLDELDSEEITTSEVEKVVASLQQMSKSLDTDLIDIKHNEEKMKALTVSAQHLIEKEKYDRVQQMKQALQ